MSLLSVFSVVMLPVLIFLMTGFFTLQPNQARVLVLFGKYCGTVRDSGFHWANPLYSSGPGGRGAGRLSGAGKQAGSSQVRDTAQEEPLPKQDFAARAHHQRGKA